VAMTISVILPTHDRPEGLAQTVESILRQTRLPDELIVVNDGQAEIDQALPAKAEAAGVRFIYRRRSPPSSAASRNCALELATGDIAMLLDDDIVAPGDLLARLEALYAADTGGVVGGICGRYVEQGPTPLPSRVWQAIAAGLAENRWAPRVSAGRYASLPPALRGRLVPTWRLVGGAASLRRRVYEQYRFTEAFGGYSLGEDTEMSFRIGAREALFAAPELTILHVKAPEGRPANYQRGRCYVANMLYIARNSVQRGVGTWLLLGYHLAGMIALAAVWSLLSLRRGNLRLAGGMAAELLAAVRGWVGRQLCG